MWFRVSRWCFTFSCCFLPNLAISLSSRLLLSDVYSPSIIPPVGNWNTALSIDGIECTRLSVSFVNDDISKDWRLVFIDVKTFATLVTYKQEAKFPKALTWSARSSICFATLLTDKGASSFPVAESAAPVRDRARTCAGANTLVRADHMERESLSGI